MNSENIKMPKRRLFECEWRNGDVYAYKLESDFAKEKGLFGQFFLIQKIDENIFYPGHIVPIVYIKITPNYSLPSTVEEFNQLEFVQTFFTKYEERFFPIDASRPQEDIAEKAKLNYDVDEFGLLPQFRATLVITSKKHIPSKLIFVGNFSTAAVPQKEFIPHSKINIVTLSWKKPEEMFESKLIKRYCGYNLREFEIYSKHRD